MEKQDYYNIQNKQPRIIDTKTAKRFMSLFYEASPQPKKDHTAIKNIWDKIQCMGKKSIIIKELVDYSNKKRRGVKQAKIKCTCLEYLKSKI